jgi:assimilatory nitrate reductase catalytic subunit
VIATNPAHSWIDQNDFTTTVRAKLDFLVTQDMYHTTETAQLSDLVLPAAGWGEKDGTFINSERRFGTLKKVRRAPGKALSDFLIFKLIAKAWGCDELFKNWNTAEDVFQSLKAVSKGQPCDISGIPNYYALDEQGGVQWPCPEGTFPQAQQRRLFENGEYYRPNKRAKFCFEQPVPHPEEVDYEYRYTLLTGRGTSAQWHTQSRTAKSPTLKQLYPQKAYIEVNPSDAHNLSLQDGDWVCVESRRGSMNAMAFLTHAVQPGQLFLPMHYPEVNRLTQPVFDTYSRQPSYKACAVKIWKVSAPGKGKQRDFVPGH